MLWELSPSAFQQCIVLMVQNTTILRKIRKYLKKTLIFLKAFSPQHCKNKEKEHNNFVGHPNPLRQWHEPSSKDVEEER